MYAYARHPYIGAMYMETHPDWAWGAERSDGELTVYAGRLDLILTRAKLVRQEMRAARPRPSTLLAIAVGVALALFSTAVLAYCPPGDYACQASEDADRRQAEMRYTAQQADQWRYQTQQQMQAWETQRAIQQLQPQPYYGPSYGPTQARPYRPY